jgi:cell division protein FtsL
MRLLLGVRSLPDHSLLDRIVRGRVWIPVLGILLAGIVATQVEVLRLNASMGQALRKDSTLSIRNQALRISVAELSDQARIERLAARMGMVMPGPTTLSFVPANAGAAGAVQDIHAPAPAQFVAQLPSPASSDGSGASSGSSSGSGTSGSGSSSSSTDTSGSSGSSGSGTASGSGTTDTSSSSGTSTSGSSSGG